MSILPRTQNGLKHPGAGLQSSVGKLQQMKVISILVACLLLTACQTAQPPQNTATPTAEPVSTVMAPPLGELVEFLRAEGGVPQTTFRPRMATSENLPAKVSPDSIDQSSIPKEVADYVNSLSDQGSWSQFQVDEATKADTDEVLFYVALSQPTKLSDGRWYALAEWTRKESGTIKKVGVVSYALVDGRLQEPDLEILLSASSVEPRKLPSGDARKTP